MIIIRLMNCWSQHFSSLQIRFWSIKDQIFLSTFSCMWIGILLPFCWKALKSLKNWVWTVWFSELPILVHNLGYVVLTQLEIAEVECLSSEISLTDLPAGFCWCKCTPIRGSILLPRMLARRSFTTIKEAVFSVQPPQSMGAMNSPNDGIF